MMSDSQDDSIKTGSWGVIRRIVMEPDPSGGWRVSVEKTQEQYAYSDPQAAERSAMDLGARYRPSIVIIRSSDSTVKSERVFLLNTDKT
jgi:hypothetical protein